MAVTKANVSKLFMGQSDMILFDEVTDYNTAKLSDLKNPKSLGDIDEGSTSWTGDASSVEPRKNEQGEAVTSKITNGTVGWEFRIMTTDPAMVKLFLSPGVSKTIPTTGGGEAWSAITNIVGFGSTAAVQTRPIMMVNDEGNRSILCPKAKIAADLTLEDGLVCIHVSVTAEAIDTANLDTAMLIDGKLNYEGETAA